MFPRAWHVARDACHHLHPLSNRILRRMAQMGQIEREFLGRAKGCVHREQDLPICEDTSGVAELNHYIRIRHFLAARRGADECDVSDEDVAFTDFAKNRFTDMRSTRDTGRIRIDINLQTVGISQVRSGRLDRVANEIPDIPCCRGRFAKSKKR